MLLLALLFGLQRNADHYAAFTFNTSGTIQQSRKQLVSCINGVREFREGARRQLQMFLIFAVLCPFLRNFGGLCLALGS